MRVEYQPQTINYQPLSKERQETNSVGNSEEKDTWGAVDDIDYVTVELSEEARTAFQEHILNDNKSWMANQEILREEKSAQLQEMMKGNYVKKLHHIFPNVWTNDKIERSIKGQPWEFENEVYSVIYNKILPYNVESMTENERKAQISDGLAELKKMSEGLDADKTSLFMEAMNEVAQYGYEGKVDNEGNVKYDIKAGPALGAPADFETLFDCMKREDPEAYAKYMDMCNEAFKRTGEWHSMEAQRFSINWYLEKHGKTAEETKNEDSGKEDSEKQEKSEDITAEDIIEKSRHEMSKAFEKYSMQQRKMRTVSYLMNSMRKISTYA